MIYHIFNGRVYHLSPAIIKSILDCFVQENKEVCPHFFCVLMTGKEMLYKNVGENSYTSLFEEYSYTNYKIIYTNKDYVSFLFRLEEGDRLIYHSGPDICGIIRYITDLWLIIFRKRVVRDSSFISWGSDCFTKRTSIKQRIKAFIMNVLFDNLKNIVTLSTDDQKETAQTYPHANVILASYYSSKKMVLLDKILTPKFHVMVSHSGWPHNKHQRSFELLQRFAGKIQVSCPLCYGNAEYIDTVIKKGKEIFGNDFYYFKDLKTREEYSDFMRSVDAYVTSAEIQTGLGAVSFAIESGVKIFTKGNVYNFLRSYDYKIYNTDDISNLSCQDFLEPMEKVDCIHNININNEINKTDGDLYNRWVRIFYD